jgi:hypothetical protein
MSDQGPRALCVRIIFHMDSVVEEVFASEGDAYGTSYTMKQVPAKLYGPSQRIAG